MGKGDAPKKSWRVRVLDKQAELLRKVDEANGGPPSLQAVIGEAPSARSFRMATQWLESARAVVATPRRPWQAFLELWRGGDIDEAWTSLHRVEVLLVELTPDEVRYESILNEARERARGLLKATDERLKAIDKDARDLVDPNDESKFSIGTMRKASVALAGALGENDDQYRRLRSFRNILVWATLGALLLATALTVIGAVWPAVISMCWTSGTGASAATTCPGGAEQTPWDVLAVQILGLAGAAVVALTAIQRLKGTSTPYAIPLMSLIIKLPLGAITAVLGLLLVHLLNSFTIDSKFEIAAYALAFGASQELFTRFIDKQAQNVLNTLGSPGKENPPPLASSTTTE